ncbi:hypothetical protein [Actinophytocola glycyrrhizae]|uniref:Uncharacterized protein n=1 Tax=Actinophytocola glycyrrhizae TaxID=2044873 RepID=A0ABV9RV55_9PSEU
MNHLAYALFPSPRLAARFGIPRRSPLVAIVAFPFAVLAVFLVWSGWLYPLRPDTVGALGHPFTADPLLSGAWGGPTLAGAWFVHAMIALGMQAGCVAVLRRLSGRVRADAV